MKRRLAIAKLSKLGEKIIKLPKNFTNKAVSKIYVVIFKENWLANDS